MLKTTSKSPLQSKYLKESCIESLEEAQTAVANGASQLEVCARLDLDGLTPSPKLVDQLSNSINIPFKLMIRNREGNFIYTKTDADIMLQQIKTLKKFKPEGFVMGALTDDHALDVVLLNNLCLAADPYPITIHKCVDLLEDIQELEKLKSIPNVKFVLSSGQSKTAREGVEVLKKMKMLLAPEITLIPAGKITKENVNSLHSLLDAKIYHGRKIV